MVVSRILFSFAEDHAVPSIFSKVNSRFSTPHIALTMNTLLVLLLLWTNTMGYIMKIALQCMFILYIGHSLAMILLPYIRKDLFNTAIFKPAKGLILTCGIFAIVVLLYFSFNMILHVLGTLLVWAVVGVVFYLIGKREGKIAGFDYKKQMEDELSA
ncbi:hypothetical protein [Virgibacillus sp. DJP39]|uniref:hypothetical protein n=1 Tax=Virgibacillus sp. DJP39 TaxID=3409790 RepID=UPI003BB77C67